jgi:hypothetical protein
LERIEEVLMTGIGSPDRTAPKHAAIDVPETLRDRLRDALSPKTLGLALSALLLQLGFVLSYLGAFHAPAPHSIPVAVVAPPAVAEQVVDTLNKVAGQPVSASSSTEAVAREALMRGDTSAVYLVDPAGTTDHLLVASGGGASRAGAVQTVFTTAAKEQQRTVVVEDLVPLSAGDGRGMSGFYLVTGWAVGGYLFASMLGVAKGARPANLPRALWRIGATVPYAALAGLGGALIAEKVLGALGGHFWEVVGVGVLVTLSASTVAIALQTLLGTMGIGLTILIFVILGNPSAGGAYQSELLPPFWRALGGVLPNGAGTDAVRRIVYFGAQGAGHGVAVLLMWVLSATVVALAGAALIHRNNPDTVPAVFGGWRPVRFYAGESGGYRLEGA